MSEKNEMPEKKKRDYLELAKECYLSAKTYDNASDVARIKAAQTLAMLAIAEELQKLNETLAPKITPMPTPRPEPSDKGFPPQI